MTTRARAVYEIRAIDKTRAAVTSAQSNMRRLDATVKRFAGGLGAGIGLGAVTTVVDRVTSDAQKLDQALENFDFRLGEWQRFNIAADQAGVGIKQLETAFQRMARRVSQAAAGTGEAQEALRELNLDAARLEQLSIADQFDAITEAVEPLARPDKIRLLQKIFDSEGVKAVLDTMRAVDDLNSSFDDLLLTQSQLDNLLVGKTWIDDFTSKLKLLTSGTVADFIGAIQKILDLSKQLDVAVTKAFSAVGIDIGETLGVSELDKVNQDLQNAGEQLGSNLDTQTRINKAIEDGLISQELGNQQIKELNEILGEQKDIYDNLLERKRALERVVAAPGGRGVDPSRGGFYAPGSVRLDGRSAPTGAAPPNSLSRSPAISPIDFPDPRQVISGPNLALESFYVDFEGKRIVDDTTAAMDELTDAEQRAASAAQDLGFTFSSALEDAIVNAEDLQTLLQGLIQDIARIVLRQTVTQPLANSISGFFQPKALGGPVMAGGGYLVGEKGPELFVPSSSGNVIPNNQLGGGSANITFNVTAMDSQSVLSAIGKHEKQITGMVRRGFARRGSRVDIG